MDQLKNCTGNNDANSRCSCMPYVIHGCMFSCTAESSSKFWESTCTHVHVFQFCELNLRSVLSIVLKTAIHDTHDVLATQNIKISASTLKRLIGAVIA